VNSLSELPFELANITASHSWHTTMTYCAQTVQANVQGRLSVLDLSHQTMLDAAYVDMSAVHIPPHSHHIRNAMKQMKRFEYVSKIIKSTDSKSTKNRQNLPGSCQPGLCSRHAELLPICNPHHATVLLHQHVLLHSAAEQQQLGSHYTGGPAMDNTPLFMM
jgi:hypothetical protein